MPVRHLILFRVYDDVLDTDVERALGLLRGLRHLPGILEWRVELSTDRRKGRVIVQDSVFADAAAIGAFRLAPDHKVSSDLLATMADWVVGDYEL